MSKGKHLQNMFGKYFYDIFLFKSILSKDGGSGRGKRFKIKYGV